MAMTFLQKRGFGPVKRAALGLATRFSRDEDGNLTVLALIMVSLMIAFGGLAVDMMRYEAMRAELQNTLDRAALAAASLTQELDPELVVADYFDKAGLTNNLVSVTATQGLNFRRVDAEAEADVNPFFMQMVGLDNLHAVADSAAEQRITNVEVMMVLDVSGSMNSNGKLKALQDAAVEFVGSVLGNDTEDKISISLVPFNGQVNLGASLRGKFNATNVHGVANVNCFDLPDDVYDSTDISRSTPMSMTADVDTYSSTSNTWSWSTSNQSPNELNKWCPPRPTNVVRLPSQNIGVLQGYINGLQAVGATSINAGLKWGLALMDPEMESTYAQYILAGDMPDTLEQRPFEFSDNEAMKVIVLMTDGEHFKRESLVASVKTGPSPLYIGTSDGNRSIFFSDLVTLTNATTICNSRPYWVPHRSAFQSRPWSGTDPVSSACYDPDAVPTGATVLQWQQVWSAMRLSYVVQQFYVRAGRGSFSTLMGTFREQTSISEMNDQLQEICSFAKENGVLIYGIAFTAPVNGREQIRSCATSVAYYFDAANNTQLQTAFRTIANNISQLRLMQ
jgi:Flp pilus assembly protein TadG